MKLTNVNPSKATPPANTAIPRENPRMIPQPCAQLPIYCSLFQQLAVHRTDLASSPRGQSVPSSNQLEVLLALRTCLPITARPIRRKCKNSSCKNYW